MYMPGRGLEPPFPKELVPKTSASTISPPWLVDATLQPPEVL